MENIPENMREVSWDEFFEIIGPLNCAPNHHNPYFTDWEIRHTRRLIGRSFPGWENPELPGKNERKQWFISEDLIK